jgi:hypothetical protein
MPWAPSAHLRGRLSAGAVYVFFLAIAALSTRYTMPLIDDVHITLRHSVNLAHGNGLVYNPGERLLGASSPVYAALLALFVPIFSNAVVPAIYLWPVTLAAAALLAHRLVGRGPLGIVAGVVLCTDPGLSPIVGMETTFYAAVLFSVLALFEAGRLEATAFLLGLLPMVRPDGIFLVAAVVLVWVFEHRSSLDRAFLVRNARLAGIFVAPLAVWCVFATAYYGSPLPNSFVAKYFQSKLTWWFTDSITWRFLFEERLEQLRYRLLTGVAVVGAVVAFFRWDRVLGSAALFIVLYVTAYWVSRVPGYPNYFFPVFGMMTVLGFRGLGVLSGLLAERLRVHFARPVFVRARLGAAAVAAFVSFVLVFRDSNFQLFSPVGPPNQDMAYVKIARYMKDHVPRAASVAAMEIGIIGYYSGSKIVDFAGLVSKGVMPAVAAGDRRYVLEAFRPDYVVARCPVPLTLEGGLTESEIDASYQSLFAADGVCVARALRPPKGGAWDVSADAEKLNAYPGTVFIAKEHIEDGQLDALDHAVEPHGSLFVRTLSGESRDVTLKRFAYASFREGHVAAVEPLMDASELDLVQRLPRFEFDDPRDNFGEWNDVATRGPEDSMLHIETRKPDAYLAVPVVPFAPWLAGRLRIRLRVNHATRCTNGGKEGALLWVTDRDRHWGTHGKSIPFTVKTDGEWHELRIELRELAEWNGSGIVKDVRYDPLYCVADMDIDYFRFE